MFGPQRLLWGLLLGSALQGGALFARPPDAVFADADFTGEPPIEQGTSKPPQRVVSINLCADQLAMMLAAKDQLISVSWLAQDPMSSPMAASASAYVPNRAGAEQIYLLRPDLVLAGYYSSPATLDLLARLGLRVVIVPKGTGLKDVAEQIRAVAAALGQKAKGEAMIEQFERDLALLESPKSGARAIAYGPNGYSSGEGTMADDLLDHAGFDNLAADLGLAGGGMVALETLVMQAPDLIVTSKPYAGASRAEEMLAHPALASLEALRLQSGPEWVCATPYVLGAAADLARSQAELTP